MMLASNNKNKEVQRFVRAFVDDGDFCTSGVESERKNQKITNYFATMYESTGGKLQKEKFMMHV